MKELIVEVLKIVAPISVALIVCAQALGVAPRKVGHYIGSHPGLMLRSVLAAVVLVPAAAFALIVVLAPPPALAFGLVILIACPPAPLMLKSAPRMGGGSASFMASLHLVLAVLAFVTVPAVLQVLTPLLGFDAEVDRVKMATILAKSILLPIGVGMAVHAFAPGLAERAAPVLEKIGSIGMAVVVLVLLVAFHKAILTTAPMSYLVIVLVAASALAIGHWLGPDDAGEKTILAVECGVRHPALSITIAASTFTPAQALPVMVPCVVTCIAVAMAYLLWRGKTTKAAVPA